MHECLAVTCDPHFGQNNWDLACATVVAWGWNRYQNIFTTTQEADLGENFLSCHSCWESIPQQVCCSTTELSPIIIHTKICWLFQSEYYIIIQSLWCSWSSLSYLCSKSVMFLSGLSYSHPTLVRFPSKVCHALIQSLMFPPKICHAHIHWVILPSRVRHAPIQSLMLPPKICHTHIHWVILPSKVCHAPIQSLMFPSKACHIHAQLTHCCNYTVKWGETSYTVTVYPYTLKWGEMS